MLIAKMTKLQPEVRVAPRDETRLTHESILLFNQTRTPSYPSCAHVSRQKAKLLVQIRAWTDLDLNKQDPLVPTKP